MKKRKTRFRTLSALMASAWIPIAAAGADVKSADVLFDDAMASFRLERWEEAATRFYDFMAAAPNDPRNPRAQYLVGRAFLIRRYNNKAIEELGYLIEDFPDTRYAALGYYQRALAHREIHAVDQAVADFESFIRVPPDVRAAPDAVMRRQFHDDHRAAVFWLARHYLENEQPEAAVAAYRHLPNPIEAFRHVVNVYYDLGRYEKIRELIDNLQEENRHQGFKFLIEFYGKRGAVNQLRSIFSRLLEEPDPTQETDELVWTTAISFEPIGAEELEWALRRVMDVYPRMARKAAYERSRRNWRNSAFLDDMEVFVIQYREGLDVDQVLRWKGITLEQSGQAEDARRDYRRMGNAGLGHWFACQTFDGRYAREKDIAGAIEEYIAMRRAHYSREWAALAQWRVAELYDESGQVDEAVAAYRQVAGRFAGLKVPRHTRYGHVHYAHINVPEREYAPEALLAAGDVLREAGRFEDAIMEYRGAVTRFPKTEPAGMAAYRTALCHEELDEVETAVATLKSTLRRFPATRGASEAHTRLETRYDIADVEVSDQVDVFSDESRRRTRMEENR